MSEPLSLLVTGCLGRMGQAVIDCAEGDPDVTIGAAVDLKDSLEEALQNTGAVIDFTAHGFTTQLCEAAVATGNHLVIGTTGHTDEERAVIEDTATKVPVVFAPNFSVGVNTLFWLTRKTTEILGSDFDLEVIEMHHRLKTDAPSGTARRLAEVLAEARELSYDKDVVHGREGDVGARTRTEIGMHSMRGGDVVGDHTVVYSTFGERVELTHKASSRDTFAKGAIRAAKWLRGKSSGLYDMQDVLGLVD